jgi:hypothetical protein
VSHDHESAAFRVALIQVFLEPVEKGQNLDELALADRLGGALAQVEREIAKRRDRRGEAPPFYS